MFLLQDDDGDLQSSVRYSRPLSTAASAEENTRILAWSDRSQDGVLLGAYNQMGTNVLFVFYGIHTAESCYRRLSGSSATSGQIKYFTVDRTRCHWSANSVVMLMR